MMKKYFNKNVIRRGVVLLLAIILVLSSSSLKFLLGDEMSQIYGSFIGKKSDYNGVIELWNIDSFESGNKPKNVFLQQCASRFQNENKGVYVVVRNLTESECLNLMHGGVFPDLISCSYGVSDRFKEFYSSYSNCSPEINEKFINAGRNQKGELLGLAWCVGYYFLISSKAKLEKVKGLPEEYKLNEVAFDCGYEYKIGKKNKTSVSLGFGTGDYLMPKNALIAYNKARSIQTESLTQNELKLKSQYSAYSSFLANDSTILLGTQRDVWRMQAREESGKISEAVYLPLCNWTDLVQYVFILKTSDGNRRMSAEKFAFSFVSKTNQNEIESIGMFPVRAVDECSYNGVMLDIIHENFSDLELKPLFE